MAIELTKELLLSVRKPARYIGGEVNSIKKDLSKMFLKVCLCFPDTYEIGMSHLGLRILYDLINKQKDCVAERVFSPWVDMEERLKTNHIPLFSLESKAAVRDFDILGFSLQYALAYTNVLNILHLSGIPLRASERRKQHPLVIAGGSCCLNPEPMAEFIDCFIIGEAEEVILEVIEIYKQHKLRGGIERATLLKTLSLIEGVYIPSLYQVEEKTYERTALDSKAPLVISKRYVRDLEKVLNLEHWIVPYIEIVHDRIGIEIMRGCPNNCRFCQARTSFYPWRILSAEKILETIRRLYRMTGYEEISLLSLSSSDHPQLDQIVKSLMEEFKNKGVSISLPSLRPNHLVGELSKLFSSMRKTTLTFAPEAGSERLRRLINKNVEIEELFDVARRAYQAGYRLLKLYFMIGLPTESREDLEAIRDMCVKLSQMKKEIDGHPARLNVTLSNFIPKPHTPFQWQAMTPPDDILEKQDDLRSLFRRSKGMIRVKFHDARASFLEAVLSRGDRRISRVIRHAFEAGAKFDAWGDLFNFSLWMDAFSRNSIDPKEYLIAKAFGDRLSWDFIDMGISRENLIKEARLTARVTCLTAGWHKKR